jgi:hypothetical protein
MRIPLLTLIGVAVVLQTGCVTGRRTLSLPVSTQASHAAVQGRVYIATLTDNRHFENKPSDPSVPSIDGDVTKLSAQEKDRMIGRQRNGFGKAMGDIGLAENDSVTKRARLLVGEGLRRKGYELTDDPKAPTAVGVSIDEFWAWGTPGFWTLTFEAKLQCTISVTTAAGVQTAIVKGYGINYGQVAKDVNWQEAYDPAFEDFMSNLGSQWDNLLGRTVSSASNAKIDGDLYEQLNKLDALRKSGVLTEQEFDAQKKRILAP